MWTVVAGFDLTDVIPFESNNLQQTINDPAPSMTFTVTDDNQLFSFNINDEVIVWDESAPPHPSLSLHLVPSPPSHNIVQLPSVSNATITANGAWTLTGALTALFTGFPGLFPSMTFANTTYTGSNNTCYATTITPSGYVHAGQSYMFSIYVTIATPLTNALGLIIMQFLDGGQNTIGSPIFTSFSSTTGNMQQRITVSGMAPSNAAYVQCWFGGQATTSGSNSGTIAFGTPQCEPMWFTNRGVSYPTPDCNFYQNSCATMPDGTTSRAVRLFSGTINDFKKTYIGSACTWQIQCAGPGAILENGQINTVYTGYYDAAILYDVILNTFSTQITYTQANITLPLPIIQGVMISSTSYSDNSLREVLNSLIDASGYVYFLDNYYRIHYQPPYTSNANFTLSDTPDGSYSYPYYNYQYEQDGTQLKRRIKINGGTFSGNRQDLFSGNASTKQFTLTYIPDKVASILVGTTAQRMGVYGRDQFSSGRFDVLLNTQLQYILFNTAPATGTNNIVVTYTYKAPVTTQTTLQTSGVIAPSYTQSLGDVKINDTNITDLTTATTRGLAEIAKSGAPIEVITFSAQQFAAAGQAILFTSVSDGILNQPIIVQSVTGIQLGKSLVINNPVNEFQYSCGGYQPTLIDQIRNTSKAVNRSATVANITAAQQFDYVAMETIGYHDAVTATIQPTYGTNVYGTGRYGSMAYGGTTGQYGNTATYGQSTIYG